MKAIPTTIDINTKTGPFSFKCAHTKATHLFYLHDSIKKNRSIDIFCSAVGKDYKLQWTAHTVL